MKKTSLLILISILLSNCISKQKLSNSFESDILKIEPLSEAVFIHVSYLETNDFGKVACNGMVYFNENEAIVFDTPIDDEASRELIDWIEKERKKKIKGIVATHFHNDCLGGLKQFHNSSIKSYANHETITLAKENQEETLPQQGFKDQMEIKIGEETVLIKFFGQGHTRDNIVAHIPSENTLFGGCLIKSVNASKGYLGDANVAEWSETVEKIKKEMPDLKKVIPGHGKSGGVELLDYTIQLFKNH